MNTPFLTAFVGVLLCSGVARAEGPFPSPASPTERTAQAQYFADQAYSAYQHEDWPQAISAYLESFKYAPTSEVLFNVAVIYDRKLGNKASALEYYTRHNASSDTKPELVARAQKRIDELRSTQRPTPADATTKPASAAVASAPEPAGSGSGLLIGAGVAGGLGIAGLGIATGFGISAMGKVAQAKKEGCASGACPDAASAAKDRAAFQEGTVATVGFVAGGVLAAGGLTLLLLGLRSTPEAHATLNVAPAVGPGQVGVTLLGHF